MDLFSTENIWQRIYQVLEMQRWTQGQLCTQDISSSMEGAAPPGTVTVGRAKS